jgi:hypothetical protein
MVKFDVRFDAPPPLEDIVKRLRDAADGDAKHASLLREAANNIEFHRRLFAEIERQARDDPRI